MISRLWIFVSCSAFVLTGCKSDRFANDPVIEKFEISHLNLVDSLAATSKKNPDVALQDLYHSFGNLWLAYCEDLMKFGPANDSLAYEGIQAFLHHPDMLDANEAIQQKFTSQLPTFDAEFDHALYRYQGYLGDKPIPTIVYLNSGFNFSVLPQEGYLGIGMEYFLGTDHPVVQHLNPQVFPQYMRDKMKSEFLISESLRGWLLVSYQDDYYSERTLLDVMMYWGKMMYILDVMLPEASDAVKMSYTAEEQAWCEQNERNIWIEISKQEVLYEKRRFEINHWIDDGPFTNAENIPQDAPSRLGVWMGREIVRDYMERNDDVTLQDLLKETNYMPMLNAYRPD
jgi:hypothetical protein